MKDRIANAVRSRIVRKLLLHILGVEVGAFLLIMVLSATILWPRLEAKAVAEARSANEQITALINQVQISALNNSKMMLTSGILEAALKTYYTEAPSEQNKQLINLTLLKMISSQNFIQYIHIRDEAGHNFNSITKEGNVNLDVLRSPWYDNILRSSHASGFSTLHSKDVSLPNTDSIVHYDIMAYATNYYIGEQKITMTIFCNIKPAIDSANTIAHSFLNGYLISNRDNATVYSPGGVPSLPNASVFSQFKPSSSQQLHEKNGYYFLDTTDLDNWRIISFTANSTLYASFIGIFILTSLLFLVLVLLTFLFITPVVYRVVQPVNRLADTMKKVSDGDLNRFSDIETQDEIGDLSHMFNSMVTSINDYIRRIYEREETEQRMKYSLLISQIDPHFIHNTLNILNALARKGQTEAIVNVNTALIKILQDRLRINEIQVYDSVRQEVDILKQYLTIINFRYENSVQVVWDVDESLLEEEIPKNLLQPLVENSYFHGLINEDGEMSGEIRISIQRQGDSICIAVADNGCGMDEAQREILLRGTYSSSHMEHWRGKHIGVSNVRERLRYLYRADSPMQVESTPGAGTTILLTLPQQDRRDVVDAGIA